jgi:negative regulator of flagellin synthesis FlgM
MPIEIGPKGPGVARAVGAVDPRAVRAAREDSESGKGIARAVGPASPRPVTDPGEAPVDTDRVAVIRKAIERGAYPVLPVRVADAMIAAGILLRSGK